MADILQCSFTEFEFHEDAPQDHAFVEYQGFTQGALFEKLGGSVFHIIDSKADERTGYLQWHTSRSTSDSIPPASVSR